MAENKFKMLAANVLEECADLYGHSQWRERAVEQAAQMIQVGTLPARLRGLSAATWFDPDKYRDSALLHACAAAGMTAEQALDELAKESAERLAQLQRLLETRAVPTRIAFEPSHKCTHGRPYYLCLVCSPRAAR